MGRGVYPGTWKIDSTRGVYSNVGSVCVGIYSNVGSVCGGGHIVHMVYTEDGGGGERGISRHLED